MAWMATPDRAQPQDMTIAERSSPPCHNIDLAAIGREVGGHGPMQNMTICRAPDRNQQPGLSGFDTERLKQRDRECALPKGSVGVHREGAGHEWRDIFDHPAADSTIGSANLGFGEQVPPLDLSPPVDPDKHGTRRGGPESSAHLAAQKSPAFFN